MSNEILGYTKEGEPIYPIKPGMIATAAIISCIKCRVCIRSAGGPMHGATCVKCTPDEYKEQSAAVRDVLAERNRQITAEGWAQPEAYQFDGQVLRDEHGNYLAEFMAYEQSFIDRLLHPQPELKAQQVGQEPAGEVHLRKGGGISLLHVELAQPLPPGTKLYTAPQPAPAQDVAGLVEAAKKADDALSALVRNDQPLETLARKYGSDWSSAIDKVRTELVIQIAAHDKQSGVE